MGISKEKSTQTAIDDDFVSDFSFTLVIPLTIYMFRELHIAAKKKTSKTSNNNKTAITYLKNPLTTPVYHYK